MSPVSGVVLFKTGLVTFPTYCQYIFPLILNIILNAHLHTCMYCSKAICYNPTFTRMPGLRTRVDTQRGEQERYDCDLVGHQSRPEHADRNEMSGHVAVSEAKMFLQLLWLKHIECRLFHWVVFTNLFSGYD